VLVTSERIVRTQGSYRDGVTLYWGNTVFNEKDSLVYRIYTIA
jgi:hypothetical protein